MGWFAPALADPRATKLNALKGRAVHHTQYVFGDGDPAYAFVHVILWIRPGRPPEVEAEFARTISAVLKETPGARFETGYLSLSVDVHEFSAAAITEHNIPAQGA